MKCTCTIFKKKETKIHVHCTIQDVYEQVNILVFKCDIIVLCAIRTFSGWKNNFQHFVMTFAMREKH